MFLKEHEACLLNVLYRSLVGFSPVVRLVAGHYGRLIWGLRIKKTGIRNRLGSPGTANELEAGKFLK